MANSIQLFAAIGLFALSIFYTALLFAYSAIESLDTESQGFIHQALEPSHHGKVHNSIIDNDEILLENEESSSSLPLSLEIIRTVKGMRLPNRLETIDTTTLSYDIHKCPPVIPKNYPVQWNVIDVLTHWNPDETSVPNKIHQGLCELDWTVQEDRQIAETYRKAELPFIIHNHSQIWTAAERWSNKDYLLDKLGNKLTRNEHSTNNNHMPYWKDRGGVHPAGWKPPTENVQLTFNDWVRPSLICLLLLSLAL